MRVISLCAIILAAMESVRVVLSPGDQKKTINAETCRVLDLMVLLVRQRVIEVIDLILAFVSPCEGKDAAKRL